MIQLNEGKISEAINIFNQASMIDSNFNYPYQEIGNEYVKSGNNNEAIRYYDFALQKDPTNISILMSKGESSYLAKLYELSKSSYEKILYLNPHHIESYIQLTLINIKLKNMDQALFFLNLLWDKNYYKVYLVRGYYNYKMKRYPESIEFFVQSIVLDPSYSLSYIYIAKSYINLNDYPNALKYAEKANEICSNSSRLYKILADIYYRMDSFVYAKHYIIASISLNREYYKAYLLKGIISTKISFDESTLESFNKCIELNPSLIEAYLEIIKYWISHEQYAESIPVYEQLLSRFPMNYEAWNGKALAYFHLNQFYNADSCLTNALRINSHYAEGWNNKGLLYKQNGKFEEAISYFKEAIRLKGNNPKYYLNLGNTFHDIGAYEESAIALIKSMEVNTFVSS